MDIPIPSPKVGFTQLELDHLLGPKNPIIFSR